MGAPAACEDQAVSVKRMWETGGVIGCLLDGAYFEAAFFQEADGSGVAFGDAGVERPGVFQAEESRERGGGDAAAQRRGRFRDTQR